MGRWGPMGRAAATVVLATHLVATFGRAADWLPCGHGTATTAAPAAASSSHHHPPRTTATPTEEPAGCRCGGECHGAAGIAAPGAVTFRSIGRISPAPLVDAARSPIRDPAPRLRPFANGPPFLPNLAGVAFVN